VNVVVSEEFLRVPGVFARDLVYFLEDAQGAQGNVLQMPMGVPTR